nr:MAG TPA: hypothetical protein [Caudoviricetes sp.]
MILLRKLSIRDSRDSTFQNYYIYLYIYIYYFSFFYIKRYKTLSLLSLSF